MTLLKQLLWKNNSMRLKCYHPLLFTYRLTQRRGLQVKWAFGAKALETRNKMSPSKPLWPYSQKLATRATSYLLVTKVVSLPRSFVEIVCGLKANQLLTRCSKDQIVHPYDRLQRFSKTKLQQQWCPPKWSEIYRPWKTLKTVSWAASSLTFSAE